MITTIKQDLFDQSQYPLHKLGQLAIDEWGSKYRYCKFGTTLVTGNLLQEPAEVTNFRSMNVAANAAIGSKEVKVDLGGTAVTAAQFEGGQLVVESSTGIGQLFRIVSHDVQTSTTGECDFVLDRPLKIALVLDTSQVSVRKNPHNAVIQYPTTPTGGPVGAALYATTTNYHGWIQSGGDGAGLYDNQTNFAADESAMIPSRDVAGSITPDLETLAAGIQIGWAREQVSVDSTMGFVHWTID